MAEFRRATGIPTATNMVATDWRQMHHSLLLRCGRHPARRSALLDDAGLGAGRAALSTNWASRGARTRTTTSTSRSRCSRTAPPRRPGRITAIDTHWIWQEGRERLTREPLRIVGGEVAVPDRPGLGVDIDMAQVEQAHELYKKVGGTARDDAIGMRYLVPGLEIRSQAAGLRPVEAATYEQLTLPVSTRIMRGGTRK